MINKSNIDSHANTKGRPLGIAFSKNTNSLIVEAPDLVITKSHFFMILYKCVVYEKT